MMIGKDFNPEVGYVRRTDILRNMAQVRFSPRPRSSRIVRRYEYSTSIDHFTRLSDRQLDTSAIEGTFGVEFQSTFVSALVQYNSDGGTMAVNARLRWEYRPGSDLFIVYSDGRATIERGFPRLQNRVLTIKLTRFFRM